MSSTQTSRRTLLSTLFLLAAAATLGAVAVPPSHRTSILSLIAGLAGVMAGSSYLLAEFGPKVQRRGGLISLGLVAVSLGVVVRMIVSGLLR